MIGARNIEDENFYVEKAVAAAAATAYTDSLDLVGEKFFAENIEFIVGHEALPDLVDDKTLTLSLEQSDDNVTFEAHADVAALVTTGVDTPGADAAHSRFRLPSGTKRYIRAKGVTLAAAGDNTAAKFYLKAKF